MIRVSVIDFDQNLIINEIVKPIGILLDPNTEFSGVTSLQIEQATLTFDDVQKQLLSTISSDTILVGHG